MQMLCVRFFTQFVCKIVVSESNKLISLFMRYFSILILSFWFYSCQQGQGKLNIVEESRAFNPSTGKSYDEIKNSIIVERRRFYVKYPLLKGSVDEITNFWIKCIGSELYNSWKNTPWDFNGTANKPNEGAIACGYFVTTILRDMDVNINRNRLAVCASSVMMKSLTPNQKIMNLSSLTYVDFDEELKKRGKAVYIVGLDFHTGFLINDGLETWFVHSNYINRKGVTKESVSTSIALRTSKTRWLVSLTNDKDFLNRWLKN
jgi:hypothetical protein